MYFLGLYLCFQTKKKTNKSLVKIQTSSRELIDDLESMPNFAVKKKPDVDKSNESIIYDNTEKIKPKSSNPSKKHKVLYKYAVHPMSYKESFDLYADMKLKGKYCQSSKGEPL